MKVASPADRLRVGGTAAAGSMPSPTRWWSGGRRLVLICLAVLAVHLVALGITYRGVVFDHRSLTGSAFEYGNEGGTLPSWNYPSLHPGVRAEDDATFLVPDHGNYYDGGAPAYGQQPQVRAAHTQLARGNLPVWTTNQGLGWPLIGDSTPGLLDPLTWPLLIRDSPLGWDSWLLGRFLIGGLLLSAFVMYCGIRWWAAPLAGVTFMLSGAIVEYGPDVEMSVYVVFPLLLLGVEMCARDRWRLGVGVTAAGAALVTLGGMPEATALCLAVAGLYALTRAGAVALEARSWRPSVGVLLAASGGVAIGLLLALPQLTTFLEFLGAGSSVHGTDSTAALISRPRHLLLGLAAPRWIEQQVGQWFGIGILVLALLGVRSRALPRGAAMFFLLLSTVTLGKLYDIPSGMDTLFYNLPIIKQIYWYRYAPPLSSVGVGILAAAGLHRLVTRRTPVASWEAAGAVAGVAALIGGAAVAIVDQVQARSGHVAIVAWTVVILVLVAALVIAAIRGGRRLRTGAGAALGILAVVEIAVIATPVHPLPVRFEPLQPTPTTEYLTRAMPAGHGRFFAENQILYPNLSIAYGIDSLQTLDAVLPDRFYRYIKDFIDPSIVDRVTFEPVPNVRMFDNPFFDALAVTHLIARGPLQPDATGAVVDQAMYPKAFVAADGVSIYRNIHAMPRAAVFFDVVPASNEAEAETLMKQPGFSPTATAIVEGTNLPAGTASPPVAAVVTSYDSTHATIEVDAPRAGVLVMADQYYPGWRASIDSSSVEIHPANLTLRGVAVPAGHHTVEITYQPRSLELGAIGVSLAAVAYGAWGWVLLPRWLRRRPSA